MFSELICDEMKKNYLFQCFLIPDKCNQVFKSFGNETRARCKMKLHLQSHIDDLIAAENGLLLFFFPLQILLTKKVTYTIIFCIHSLC